MLDAHDQHELESKVQQQDKDIEAMAETIANLEAEVEQLKSRIEFIRGHLHEMGQGL